MNAMTLRQQLAAVLQRNSIILPKLLCYILVVLIALNAAQLVWNLIAKSPDHRAAGHQDAAPRLVAPPPPSPDHGAQIARLHVMGKTAVAENIPIPAEHAPNTSLNLMLSGVLALGNGKGFAIIENQSRKNELYQIDEEITSGVTLYSVYADYVLLSRSGRHEKLSLPKSEPLLADSDFATEAASSSLASLRQQLAADPSAFAKYIVINTARDDAGRFIGYQVKPASPSAGLFSQLGLVENDIILSINDIPLNNPNQAAQVLQNLISASKLQMTVMRAGTEISLLHNLE